jgi:hypothetical protein
MQLTRFHRVRHGLTENAGPASDEALDLMTGVLDAALRAHPSLTGVEVGRTDDPDRLIVGMCRFLRGTHEQQVVDLLTGIWEDRVRFRFWSAHAFIVARGHVELEAATRVGPVGPYATVHLLALSPVVPAQRRAPVAPSRGLQPAH